MSKFGNIFYWDLKNNERISLSELDDIKTNRIVRCRIKEDRINIEPLDETDSNFNENKVWKILDVIKDDYKKVVEFLVKFKESNDWSWHRFYKKSNGDIEIVFQEEGGDVSSENGNEIPLGEPKDEENKEKEGQGVGEIIGNNIPSENDEINFDDFISSEESEEKSTEEFGKENKQSHFEKINENFITYLNTQLPKKIKDPKTIEKIKKDVSKANNIEELQNIILSYFEDMGDISGEDINKLLNLDSSSKLEFGQSSYSKGMGAFFKIQSIVNDGSLKDTNSMYNQIWNNLKSIYKKNKILCSPKEQKELKKNYMFENENPTKPIDLAKLSVIYGKFLKNWKEGNGNQDVPNSKYFRNNMTSYFPEVLTPFTILWGENSDNSQCIDKKGHEAIKMLKKKVGDGFNNSSISFPQSDYQALFDSVLYFSSSDNSHKCIRLSTKGGKNGLGAQASIFGLTTYFYKKEKLPQDIFTKRYFSLDASKYTDCYQDYMYAFAMKPENELALKILSAFMLASSNQYHNIIDNIFEVIKDKNIEKEFKDKLKFYNDSTDKRRRKPAMQKTLENRIKGLIIQDYMNSHQEFKDCVLSALKYASYDFAQVNYKESGSDDSDFHYDIFVQYPAIFEGDINFELMQGLKYHKLKFHILGKNVEQ